MLNEALCKQCMTLVLENLHFLFLNIWGDETMLASKALRDMGLPWLSSDITFQFDSVGQPMLKPLCCNEDEAAGWLAGSVRGLKH